MAEVLGPSRCRWAGMRITYTGGPSPLGSGRGDAAPTTVVVAARDGAGAGTTAVVRCRGRATSAVRWPGVKSTSYAENVVALAEAAKAGASEAVFANLAGHLCEGTGSNVGYVVGGEVRTPTLGAGCLAGVTRALLLEWCDVIEVDEPIEVLDSAEEIFLISTTRDVQGVHRLDERELVAPGPVTSELMELWSAREAEDVGPVRAGQRWSGAEELGELVVEVDEGALLAVGHRLQHRGDEAGDAARARPGRAARRRGSTAR